MAAMELVAARGWDAPTTREIAERAGINQGLINYHFGSKRGLLIAALDVALHEGFDGAVRAVLAAPTLAGGVADLVEELGRIDEAGPLVRFAMEALARAPRDEDVRRVMAEVLSELRAQLTVGVTAAQDRGELGERLDPAGTATILAAAFDGLGLHLLVDPTIDLRAAGAAAAMLIGARERQHD
jgi:AcrR family transcriptional regulator